VEGNKSEDDLQLENPSEVSLSGVKRGCILCKAAYDIRDQPRVKTESKLARQKRAAKAVAEILYASLQQFSAEEQETRMKEIHKIAMKAGTKPSRKPSKRSSTRANPRVSRRAARVR